MWEAYPRTTAWADVEPMQRFSITTTARQLLGAVYPQIVADVLGEYAGRAEAAEGAVLGTGLVARWLRDKANEVRP